jgi:hypothetical protein
VFDDMSVGDIIRLVALWLLAAGGAVMIAQEWGKAAPFENLLEVNRRLFGGTAALVIRRCIVSAGGLVWVLALGLLVALAEKHRFLPSTVIDLLAGAIVVGFVVFTGAAVGIALVNRPKLLVPPKLRDEPGLLRAASDGRR